MNNIQNSEICMTNEDEVLEAQVKKIFRQTNYLVKPLLSRKFAQIVIFRLKLTVFLSKSNKLVSFCQFDEISTYILLQRIFPNDILYEHYIGNSCFLTLQCDQF